MNRFLAIICLLSLTVGSISGATRYKGDLNNDGKVNLADMAVLANAINEGKTDKNLHDVNASGNVNNNDLHALANIILSEKLTEDTGLNVGIGGWEDDGEDFGGSVGASTRGTRTMDDVRLYIEGPKSDLEKSLTYVDFGIEPSSEGVSAILFNIQVPNDVVFESGKYAMLYNELIPGHAIYGTPVIKQDSEWEKRLRFIVFSPKLDAIEESAPIGRLVYSTLNETGGNSVSFKNCQVISKGSATMEEIPEHGSWINSWTPKLISSLSIEQGESLETYPGEYIWLSRVIDPVDASYTKLKWTSSNPEIVSIDSANDYSANCTAHTPGEAVITVSALDGSGCNASIRFIVKDPVIVIPVLSLEITNADTGELIPADGFSLEVGNGIRLGVKFTPENATDKRVEWSSSDERVATVTQDGYLEIRGEGNAQIKAKSLDGSGIEATFQILGKSGIDSIFNDPNARADVYNLRGILVISQASASDIETLPKGTYILHTPRTTVKIRK